MEIVREGQKGKEIDIDMLIDRQRIEIDSQIGRGREVKRQRGTEKERQIDKQRERRGREN